MACVVYCFYMDKAEVEGIGSKELDCLLSFAKEVGIIKTSGTFNFK
jgi:hypothetical protein